MGFTLKSVVDIEVRLDRVVSPLAPLVHSLREALAVLARRLPSGLVPLGDDPAEGAEAMTFDLHARVDAPSGDVGIGRTLDRFGDDHDHLDDLLDVRAAVERLVDVVVEERVRPA